jgi:signal transduction histidine kinase
MNDPQPTAPLLEWMRPTQWLWMDTLAGVGYGLLAFLPLVNGASSTGGWLAASVGAVALAVPVVRRRRAPLTSLGVLLATLGVMAVSAPSSTVMALPPIVLVLYTVATETRLSTAVVALIVTCVAVLATALRHLQHPGGILVALPVFGVAWAIGATFGLHRRHLRVQLELQDRLRRAHVRRAELELVDQRIRIARELHDVVAHGMSVITVQAGFAGLVADDPHVVRSALGSIETTGRQTLGEMRTLLEVLRDGTELDGPMLSPAPGMDDLDALIERVREAGIDVVLTRSGPTGVLPPLVELNAYRIVQEALTNVVKHAGAVRTTVQVGCADGELVIVVRDDGSPTTSAPVEPGHGIIGMRERARILGGTLRAEPLPGRGYEVVGRLPVPDLLPTQRAVAPDPA